jgi:hypothetical protein
LILDGLSDFIDTTAATHAVYIECVHDINLDVIKRKSSWTIASSTFPSW